MAILVGLTINQDTDKNMPINCTILMALPLLLQVATIARPPVDPAHKRPTTEYTGYIICIYQVFKGDDGEKFERNWLYWTGHS